LETSEQLVTIAAVLLGAITTHITNYAMERSRHRRDLRTRWDEKKLDAYATYIDRVRAGIFAAVQLYEQREGIRSTGQPEQELTADLADAARQRGRAFERLLLLAGDDVVEAAHNLNACALEIDWRALGKTTGSLQEWRELNRAGFRAITTLHEAARKDLGVSGSVTGEEHPERDLLLPRQVQDPSS
jgi:hypothetical protein